MQKLFLLAITFLLFMKSYSQETADEGSLGSISMEGEWTGSFDYNELPFLKYPISLFFQLRSDATYRVFSYSKGQDTVLVCEVNYRFTPKDSIYLEEVRQVLPVKISDGFNYQKMQLKIKAGKAGTSMEGAWYSTGTIPAGSIQFKKKKKRSP